jgi:BioD-like phosphotransacetylase family protein
VAGEENLKNIVKNIIIGAMSTADPNKNPLFVRPSLNRENQLMITAGDRSDMILAALERDTIGIILTNDIVPPQLIVAKAKERGVPVLLVGTDTFKTARAIDDMEALLTKDDPDKIKLLSQLIEKYTRVKELF